jgi:hypothetical protein
MPAPFTVSRVGLQRFMVCHKHYRAECTGTEPKQFAMTLSNLGLDGRSPKLHGELREAFDRFLALEKRAEEKLGKATTFRIWRVDAKTLQVNFGGGHSELKNPATSGPALKRCLDELGANDFLLPDLKREMAAFLEDEPLEPLPDVLFFRDEGRVKVLIEDRVHVPAGENDADVLKLAKSLKTIPPDRLLATFHAYRRGEDRIRAALGRLPG